MVSITLIVCMESLSPVTKTQSEGEDPTSNLKRRRFKFADVSDWSQDQEPSERERISDKRAAFMFYTALAWMFLFGIALPHGVSDPVDEVFRFNPIFWIPLALLWLLIIAESLLGFATAHDKLGGLCKRFLLICLLPAFRLTHATAYPPRFVWLPKRGWLSVGKLNFKRLELRMAMPMLAWTLMVIPLLGTEFLLSDYLREHLWFGSIVHILTGVLWLGFALEFLIMISLSEKRLAYCKAHWVNIVIIIIPLIMWLRLFRVLNFLRVSKMVRAFRLRSITTRGLRLATVFNLVDRLRERNPEKYLLALESKVSEKQADLKVLEKRMVEVKAKITSQEETSQPADTAAQV